MKVGGSTFAVTPVTLAAGASATVSWTITPELINAAQAEREAARAALANVNSMQTIDRAEMYAMIDSLVMLVRL